MNQLSSAATSLAASAAHVLGAPEGTAGPDKQAQLAPFCNAPTDKTPMTSNIGVAQAVHTISLKAGQRGPTVLEDSHLRETIHAFDHERIPYVSLHHPLFIFPYTIERESGACPWSGLSRQVYPAHR